MIALDYRAMGARPVQPLYTSGIRCPSCHHGGWHVGHRSAECGRCGTVLPLACQESDRAAGEVPAA